MLTLNPFTPIERSLIKIEADLQVVNSETVDLFFHITDPENQIVFSPGPVTGRYVNLWQQTCFEAFIQPAGGKKYFEINLTPKKAWNVYVFEDYRTPPTPTELQGAAVLNFSYEPTVLSARFKIQGANLEKVKISLCVVVFLKDIGPTYWSVQHSDHKPNFHHFDSFITEKVLS